MYIIGIALLIAAVTLWLVAVNLTKRKDQLFQPSECDQSEQEKAEDEALIVEDVKALLSFAKVLRWIGVGCAIGGLIMFWL